jgi:acyl-CoA thioester hydrolase
VKTPPGRSDFVFFHTLRVRWAEVDLQKIVFNPHYFTYFDCAVTEYMRTIGFPYPDGFAALGTDTFAVNAIANFRASARYDDLLDIGARVAHIGRTSFRVELGVFRHDELLVDGALVYVNGALDTHTPQPVPQSFIERVAAWERIAPTRT